MEGDLNNWGFLFLIRLAVDGLCSFYPNTALKGRANATPLLHIPGTLVIFVPDTSVS